MEATGAASAAVVAALAAGVACWKGSGSTSASSARTTALSATRSDADWHRGRPTRRGNLVVFNGPSSAGKSTLVKAVQEALARRSGVPLRDEFVYLRVAYDDLDVLLPQNALPDLFVFEGDTMRLRQPGEGGVGGKQTGELGFSGEGGTALYWFEDKRAELPGGTGGSPAQAIVNHPIADTCLRGQHRSWVAMCGAGNNVLADHWMQEPWWRDDLTAAVQEAGPAAGASAVHYIHVDCSLAELERRESSRGVRLPPFSLRPPECNANIFATHCVVLCCAVTGPCARHVALV